MSLNNMEGVFQDSETQIFRITFLLRLCVLKKADKIGRGSSTDTKPKSMHFPIRDSLFKENHKNMLPNIVLNQRIILAIQCGNAALILTALQEVLDGVFYL
uniref:Uncharacterized protein n=1 Tax=Cacopsylla melanoneura TaxID=428564 RepID=A0A8D8T4B9_9HEMI